MSLYQVKGVDKGDVIADAESCVGNNGQAGSIQLGQGATGGRGSRERDASDLVDGGLCLTHAVSSDQFDRDSSNKVPGSKDLDQTRGSVIELGERAFVFIVSIGIR